MDQIDKLCAISLARLPRMLDPVTGLFAFRIEGHRDKPVGSSVRYTAITEIGLRSAAAHGLSSPVDLDKLDAALSKVLPDVDNSGDLGLILWATAGRNGLLAEETLRRLLSFGRFERVRGGNKVHSTELAWVTRGLAEALAADVGSSRVVEARLGAAFRRLMEMRGASGLMCFARPVLNRIMMPKDFLQSELGFFDAQVYTIQAALRYDELLGSTDAREAAFRIGEILLSHQHALGQWAWHYNVRTGRLVDLYPVYSVHQDGMAPMALLPLERALGLSTTSAVARGVEWLFGRNELGFSMANPERALIRRSIRRRDPLKRVVVPLKLASLARLGHQYDIGASFSDPSSLEVDRELRPYHLGWCLHAFSELVGEARRRKADEAWIKNLVLEDKSQSMPGTSKAA